MVMKLIQQYRSISADVYFWLLTILAISLPFSPFIISLSQILLLLNWLLQENIKERYLKVKRKKSLLFFLLIYLVHIVWLFGTDDFGFAPQDLKIKLPLLVLPLVIATSEPLESGKIKLLLTIFIFSALAATIVGTAILFGLIPIQIRDVRDISLFVSHIRLSLMIVVCMLILLHWIKDLEGKFNKKFFLYIGLFAWFLFFLILLKSLTGIVVFAVTTFILIIGLVKTIENQFLKVGLITFLYAIPFFSLLTFINVYNDYYNFEKVKFSELPLKTVNGNTYVHDTLDWHVENGYLVSINICEIEMKNAWEKRSKIKYEGKDNKGQSMRSTLARYLTSKGFTKDSVGVSLLTDNDVRNIESGYTNYLFEKKWSLTPRIYEVIWEIDQYKHNGSVNEHSVTQRIVYMSIAVKLIKKHFFFGIGTGDLPMEYANYYKTHETGLSVDRQRHTHNQFLRFFAVFGVIGFLIIMAAFIIPPFYERKWNSYYFIMIFSLVFLSFLNEDTLETQAGVTFATLFYSLFLWASPRKFK